MDALYKDSLARLRVGIGKSAFAAETAPALEQVAASYTVMRASPDIGMKLFAELYINTVPDNTKDLNTVANVVGMFLMINCPVSQPPCRSRTVRLLFMY